MTAVLAIPILGEWATAADWAAVALISVGVYVVSGAPLTGFRRGRSEQSRAGRPAERPARPKIG